MNFRLLIAAWSVLAALASPANAQVWPSQLQSAAAATPALDQPVYRSVPASPDGIGKVYMGREISHVMGWQGAAWLERSNRQQEERTDLLLPLLGVQPGMVVADIGAGTGYFSRRIAPLVGPQGRVYAVDVQAEMVKMLETLTRQSHFARIAPILGSNKEVNLPQASIDLALMVDVYHELEYPREVLASIVRALKAGGRVVFVEYRAEDPNVPIKPLHKMSEARVRREATVHRLKWERTIDHLPWQHVVVFRRPG